MSGVLVVADPRRRVTRELITAAASLRDQGCAPVRVAVLGRAAAADTADWIGSVDEIIEVRVTREREEGMRSAAAVAAIVDETGPDVVLIGHTPDGIGFAPAVAAQMGLGFAPDVTAVGWDDGVLTAQRRLDPRRGVAVLDFAGRRSPVLLLVPGCFVPVGAPRAAGPAPVIREVEAVDVDGAPRHVAHTPTEVRTAELPPSRIVVGAGGGLRREAELDVLRELATVLGAELVGTKPVIDDGLLGRDALVGQSGRELSPSVYLAFGVSGQVQHMMGVRGADTIIAVNSDPDATIFDWADLGVIGDLVDTARALTARLTEEAVT